MKIIIEKSYKDLSETLASILLGEMLKPNRVNIDLTDGSSPIGAYEIVAKTISKNPKRYHNVHYYNHDESEGETIVNGILKKQIHVPFMVPEMNIHKLSFDDLYKQIIDIENAGGLDLMILGLVEDGHFCANFPDSTQFDKLFYK